MRMMGKTAKSTRPSTNDYHTLEHPDKTLNTSRGGVKLWVFMRLPPVLKKLMRRLIGERPSGPAGQNAQSRDRRAQTPVMMRAMTNVAGMTFASSPIRSMLAAAF